MPLEILAPRRLYCQIANQLRQLIDDGEFPVGTRLPTERELAEKLGVSRPTVREALIVLEVEGRLRIKVGSGIYVIEQQPPATPPIPNPIAGPFELLNARAFVESAVAEEAARVAEAEDIARFDALLGEVEATPLSWNGWIALDRQFHMGVTATLGNAVLVRRHRAVRDAIAGHDPRRARAAMCEDFGEAPDSRPDPHRQCASRYAGRRKNARPSPRKGTPPRQRAAGNARTQLE